MTIFDLPRKSCRIQTEKDLRNIFPPWLFKNIFNQLESFDEQVAFWKNLISSQVQSYK